MTNLQKIAVLLTVLEGVVEIDDARSPNDNPHTVLEAFRNAAEACRNAIRIAKVEDTKEKDTFALYAPTFGLRADDFGRTFTFRSRTYKIVGCAPKSFKFPILGSRLPDGKTFKFQAKDVIDNLVKV